MLRFERQQQTSVILTFTLGTVDLILSLSQIIINPNSIADELQFGAGEWMDAKERIQIKITNTVKNYIYIYTI